MRRAGVLVLAAGIALAPMGANAQQAPPGEAAAAVAVVQGVATVSGTSAHAGGQGEAGATPIAVESVAGQTPALDTGGRRTGRGSAQGSVADTGNTAVGRVALLPWSAHVDENPDGTSSSGRAAIVSIVLADLVKADVLASRSDASWNEGASSAASSSDGVAVDASAVRPGLTATVLHAESSSDGDADAWVASVGEDRFVSSDDTAGRCNLPVGPVAFSCLYAREGEGDDGGVGRASASAAAADLAAAGLGGDRVLHAGIGTVGSSSGAAEDAPASAAAAASPGADAASTAGGDHGRRAERVSFAGSGLARSGADGAMLALSAVALVALGLAILALARWRVAQGRS